MSYIFYLIGRISNINVEKKEMKNETRLNLTKTDETFAAAVIDRILRV